MRKKKAVYRGVLVGQQSSQWQTGLELLTGTEDNGPALTPTENLHDLFELIWWTKGMN